MLGLLKNTPPRKDGWRYVSLHRRDRGMQSKGRGRGSRGIPLASTRVPMPLPETNSVRRTGSEPNHLPVWGNEVHIQ